jgi:rhodanese-related sulfurtransferase
MKKCLTLAGLAAAALLLTAPAARAGDHPAAKSEHPAAKSEHPAAKSEHPAATPAAAASEAKVLEVEQLAALLEQAAKNKTPLFIYDANPDSLRKEKGMIPTAIRLSSSSDYDLALLPKNKADATVFYCSSTKCGASKSAAKRAIQAGYTNVHVLPAGIAGWVKAGKPVDKLPQA